MDTCLDGLDSMHPSLDGLDSMDPSLDGLDNTDWMDWVGWILGTVCVRNSHSTCHLFSTL